MERAASRALATGPSRSPDRRDRNVRGKDGSSPGRHGRRAGATTRRCRPSCPSRRRTRPPCLRALPPCRRPRVGHGTVAFAKPPRQERARQRWFVAETARRTCGGHDEAMAGPAARVAAAPGLRVCALCRRAASPGLRKVPHWRPAARCAWRSRGSLGSTSPFSLGLSPCRPYVDGEGRAHGCPARVDAHGPTPRPTPTTPCPRAAGRPP